MSGLKLEQNRLSITNVNAFWRKKQQQTLLTIHFVSFVSIISMAEQTFLMTPRFLIRFEFKQIRRIEFIFSEFFYNTNSIRRKNTQTPTNTKCPRKQVKKTNKNASFV